MIPILLFTLQFLVNLPALFGPELGYDALWYHLPLARLWIEQKIWFVEGGLLYYSLLPRVSSLLFIPMLHFFGSLGPKLIQFSSGILASYLTFKLARKFLNQNLSIMASLFFYTSYLTSWQSTTAYVDLIRTCFELLAIFFLESKWRYKISIAGIFFGLALGTKYQSLVTIILASIIYTPKFLPFTFITFLPWPIISYYFTGNPIYPFFSQIRINQLQEANSIFSSFYHPFSILKRILLIPYYLFKPFDTLISPVFLILFPVGLLKARKDKKISKILILSLAALVIWQLTPPPSGRYILPLLPLISIISVHAFKTSSKKFLTLITYVLIFLTISLRGIANFKYLPFIFNKITLEDFLTVNSSRLPDTFIDSDLWVKNNLNLNDIVLVEDVHNLYYLPTKFDHISWKKDKTYRHLITKKEHSELKLVHTNPQGYKIYEFE